MRIGIMLTVTGVLCGLSLCVSQAGDAVDEHRPISASNVSASSVIASSFPSATILPANVTLDGIVNLEHKSALLTIRPAGSAAVSVVLREGEARLSVRVLQINTTNARVLVDNAGKSTLLSLAGVGISNSPVPDPDHIPLRTMPSPEDGER